MMAKTEKSPVDPAPLEVPAKLRRLGFMEGQFEAPDDFDTRFGAEIEAMFSGSSGEQAG